MNDIDLGDVRVFERAASLGALAAAARVLHVGRSTATRQLSRLEETVGCRLIDRDARNFVLTAEGRAFLPHAKQLLQSVGDAIASVATSDGPVRGRIHVVAPTSFAMHRLVPLLPSLLVTHPQLQVALDLHTMPARLIAEEIDLAFRTGPIDAHSLVARKIGEESLVLVASPSYLDRHGRPTEPGQLAEHAFLDARSEGEGELRLTGASGPVRVRCKSTLRSTDPLPLVELAEGGCGIARIPRDLAEDSLAAGRLEVVLPELPHEPLVMFALYRPGRNDDPRVRAVLDAVLESQKRRPSTLVRAGESQEAIPSAPVSGIRCLTAMQAAR